MRALKISLGILALTAASQVVIVVISGSVALLADTVHNFSDALTAILIGIAFVLGWRLANRRYTYGYGRAEDIAGLFVLLTMLALALLALFGRMMDRVDETVVIDAEITVAAVDGGAWCRPHQNALGRSRTPRRGRRTGRPSSRFGRVA